MPTHSVHIPTPAVGEIVTFSYDNLARRNIPVNPEIFRRRPDVRWEEVVLNSQAHHVQGILLLFSLFILFCSFLYFYIQSCRVRPSQRSRVGFGHWPTWENIWKILQGNKIWTLHFPLHGTGYLLSQSTNPRYPLLIFIYPSIFYWCKLKGGRTIMRKFRDPFTALISIFPNIGLHNFGKFRKDIRGKPILPSVSHRSLSSLLYLLSANPLFTFNVACSGVGLTMEEEAILWEVCKRAWIWLPITWRVVRTVESSNLVGQGVSSLFSSRFFLLLFISPYLNFVVLILFNREQRMWYTIISEGFQEHSWTSSLILASKKQDSNHVCSIFSFLLFSLFFFRILIVVLFFIYLNIGSLFHPIKRRMFFEDYAKQNGFDPLIPNNWYVQSKLKILSLKVFITFFFFKIIIIIIFVSFIFSIVVPISLTLTRASLWSSRITTTLWRRHCSTSFLTSTWKSRSSWNFVSFFSFCFVIHIMFFWFTYYYFILIVCSQHDGTAKRTGGRSLRPTRSRMDSTHLIQRTGTLSRKKRYCVRRYYSFFIFLSFFLLFSLMYNSSFYKRVVQLCFVFTRTASQTLWSTFFQMSASINQSSKVSLPRFLPSFSLLPHLPLFRPCIYSLLIRCILLSSQEAVFWKLCRG